MTYHLIANSGLQFISEELTLNPSQSPVVDNEKPLGYSFLIKNDEDELTGMQEVIYDILCQSGQQLVPLRDLLNPSPGMDVQLELLPTGRIKYYASGLPAVKSDANLQTYQTLSIFGCPDVVKIQSLDSMLVSVDEHSFEKVPVYEKLLGEWLPVPMFEQELDGSSMCSPTSWCRVRLEKLENADGNNLQLRAIWAFDTDLGNSLDTLRPVFEICGPTSKTFSLCNLVENYIDFICSKELDGHSLTAEAEYILGLIGISPDTPIDEKLKYLSYYVYMVNTLRLSGAPVIELHYRVDKNIDVDMVLDIGNSRTCGVLFEKGDFSMGKMLQIRDLSNPWITYTDSFDMRVAFRNAEFGSECSDDKSLFRWHSILRIGQEANKLMYAARRDDGLEELTTTYSSPKRYLWDKKKFSGKWDFLTVEDDSDSVKASGSVYISDLSQWFNEYGIYDGAEHPGQDGNKYSRSSLMTFAFIEIFLQAYMYINSVDYRNHCGEKDCRRKLRNIIITAPTAMPNIEQMTLRQCAKDAFSVLSKIHPYWENVNIIPDADAIAPKNDYDRESIRQWCYDEATASQFVYLYSEVSQKYNGEISRFISAKGHVRPEDSKKGYNGKSLTLASIDIGAGTTDLMICSYRKEHENSVKIKPVPLFWDSFYLAGDDIIKNIIQQFIIDGNNDASDNNIGTISEILCHRLGQLSNEQISDLPIAGKSAAFRLLCENVTNALPQNRNAHIKTLASNMVANYFGVDAAGMTFKDKTCRQDFNIQVSVPIAQFFLEQLRLKRPSRLYTYDEIFRTSRPADYLLRHFENHFGFRLEDIEWRFDPIKLSMTVGKTLEPLMKQLSIILDAYHIDTLILAGRPASLDAVTDIFIKFYPVSPDRLVRLNSYHVGRWYPLATDKGYFVDQKSVVAVGAMVAQLASTSGFSHLLLDMSSLATDMHSTANYIGLYNPDNFKVNSAIMSPCKNRVQLSIDTFPAFLGCKQLDVKEYHARPLYAIENYSGITPLTLTLSRDYRENRELIEIEDICDAQQNPVMPSDVELIPQSLASSSDGSSNQEQTVFWMDNGAFKFLDA